MYKFMFIFILALTHLSLYGNSEVPMTHEERIKAFEALEWLGPGVYSLTDSDSKIELSKGTKILIGEQAKRARMLSGDAHTDYVEAVVESRKGKNSTSTVMKFYPEGYISLNDWENLDASALLESITESTEEANNELKKQGLDPIHVVGWINPPTLDKQTNTVYWSLEAHDEGDEDNFVNAVAIRLARNGYEKFTLITSKSNFLGAGKDQLAPLLKAHSFDSGYRYEDYIPGDKIAEYGIAALVAASVGAKIAKWAGLLLILKKFGALIVGGIAALFYKFKNYFKRETVKS